jgi:hypothetical protein
VWGRLWIAFLKSRDSEHRRQSHLEQGIVSTFLNGEVLDEHIQLKRLMPVRFSKFNSTAPQSTARGIILPRHFGVVYDVALHSFHAVRRDRLKEIELERLFQDSQLDAGTLDVLECDTSFADIQECAYSYDGCLTKSRNLFGFFRVNI